MLSPPRKLKGLVQRCVNRITFHFSMRHLKICVQPITLRVQSPVFIESLIMCLFCFEILFASVSKKEEVSVFTV
jgi:hypothetical protein